MACSQVPCYHPGFLSAVEVFCFQEIVALLGVKSNHLLKVICQEYFSIFESSFIKFLAHNDRSLWLRSDNWCKVTFKNCVGLHGITNSRCIASQLQTATIGTCFKLQSGVSSLYPKTRLGPISSNANLYYKFSILISSFLLILWDN